jgi:hypothetical protein
MYAYYRDETFVNGMLVHKEVAGLISIDTLIDDTSSAVGQGPHTATTREPLLVLTVVITHSAMYRGASNVWFEEGMGLEPNSMRSLVLIQTLRFLTIWQPAVLVSPAMPF